MTQAYDQPSTSVRGDLLHDVCECRVQVLDVFNRTGEMNAFPISLAAEPVHRPTEET